MTRKEAKSNRRIVYLISSFIDDSLTGVEEEELKVWLSTSEENQSLFNDIINVDNQKDALKLMHSYQTKEAFHSIQLRINELSRLENASNPAITSLWKYGWVAAACLVISIGSMFYFYPSNSSKEEIITGFEIVKNDKLFPQNDKVAINENGDNKKGILAEKLTDGILKEDHVELKSINDHIGYLGNAMSNIEVVKYSTIKTPKGDQYEIRLPDGTIAILNASSKLKYPSRFIGKERRVEIEGEVYFEVAKNENVPFIVESNWQAIKVLGTTFNISAYPDDDEVKTSLLEGSVSIQEKGVDHVVVLVPGQQAKLNKKSGSLNVKEISIQNMAMWRTGRFDFDQESIGSIMNQIARWYNVEIQYEGEKIESLFSGSVSRYQNMDEVLKTLELTGKVKFKRNGTKIIVKQ